MSTRVATLARGGMGARWAVLLLGAWLFVSAFVLPRPGAVGFDMAMTGLLVVMCGICAFWAPAFRFATLAFGAWRVAMELFAYDEPFPTKLHSLVIGLAIIAFSLIPSPPRLVDPRSPAVHEGFLD